MSSNTSPPDVSVRTQRECYVKLAAGVKELRKHYSGVFKAQNYLLQTVEAYLQAPTSSSSPKSGGPRPSQKDSVTLPQLIQAYGELGSTLFLEADKWGTQRDPHLAAFQGDVEMLVEELGETLYALEQRKAALETKRHYENKLDEMPHTSTPFANKRQRNEGKLTSANSRYNEVAEHADGCMGRFRNLPTNRNLLHLQRLLKEVCGGGGGGVAGVGAPSSSRERSLERGGAGAKGVNGVIVGGRVEEVVLGGRVTATSTTQTSPAKGRGGIDSPAKFSPSARNTQQRVITEKIHPNVAAAQIGTYPHNLANANSEMGRERAKKRENSVVAPSSVEVGSYPHNVKVAGGPAGAAQPTIGAGAYPSYIHKENELPKGPLMSSTGPVQPPQALSPGGSGSSSEDLVASYGSEPGGVPAQEPSLSPGRKQTTSIVWEREGPPPEEKNSLESVSPQLLKDDETLVQELTIRLEQPMADQIVRVSLGGTELEVVEGSANHVRVRGCLPMFHESVVGLAELGRKNVPIRLEARGIERL